MLKPSKSFLGVAMLRIVWGCFLILAGFFSLADALAAQGIVETTQQFQQLVPMPQGLLRQVQKSMTFQYVLTSFLWLIGSGLVYWGDGDRREEQTNELRKALRDALDPDEERKAVPYRLR